MCFLPCQKHVRYNKLKKSFQLTNGMLGYDVKPISAEIPQPLHNRIN